MTSPDVSKIASAPRHTGPKAPLVWVVILNYNGAPDTLNCLDSLARTDYPNFRVLVVNNGSTDDSVSRLKAALTHPRVELLANPQNLGYAGGNNRGIEKALAAGADYVFILNNDTIVEPGSLAALVEAMERDPKVGIAGCPLFGPGTPARTVYGWRANLYIGDCAQWFDGPEKPRFGEVDCILGAAMLVRAETLRKIGCFDSRFFLHFEDFEFCLRARRAAYKVIIVPGPGILHLAGRTTRRVRPMALFYSTRNRVWLARRHGSLRHQLVFTLYAFFYLHPRRILGRIMRGQFDLLAPVLRGIWAGHFAYPGPYRDQETTKSFFTAGS